MRNAVIYASLWIMQTACSINTALAQKSPEILQSKIKHATDKVFPATVKISVYDTLKKVAVGGSFSGVVISNEGYILTAAHAMKPKQIYLISFPDGNTAASVGLGRIGSLDAGLIKISQKGNYPFAAIGEADTIKPGETVVSLGYPYTMDSGNLPILRVGATKKNSRNSYLQSSCLMEPGDSGGPLFDLQGKVVGIHSHILNTEEENFEVPIGIFRKYWSLLIRARNYSKEDLQVTNVLKTPVAAEKRKADTSLTFVKNRLSQQNSNLADYSCIIQSEHKNGSVSTNGVLIQNSDLPGIKQSSKYYLISINSSIGENPVIIQKEQQLTASVVKRDTINDLVLIEVDGIEPIAKSIKIDSSPFDIVPGSFALSPVKNTIKIGVIGIRPFHPGPGSVLSRLPAARIMLQDATLSTEECGGPVFDNQQRFIGLNLKRYNRTSVVIIPQTAILNFINGTETEKQTK